MVDLDAEDAGHGPQIIFTNGQDTTVEVLALHLDHSEIAGEHVALWPCQFVQVSEVDRYAGPAGLLCEIKNAGLDTDLGGTREKLVNRHLVELGQSL